ncbi:MULTISPECIES: nucleotidyltransferase family protein [Citrobacter]|uniref:nucleotidyltransferase family protein n=1 Tax=Citrobacter sp. Cm038 TaxID=2985117 RepID=UPI0019036F72|nr:MULTISPECIES: nucleotidyltransferase family protein [Citrobacter]MBJ9596492.1 nucleotidyltransferase family protein [Citrobacter werkmanii]MDM2943073.1 nucleotidyltransferase family protein [Citrobacter sp. Cm038]
MKKNWGKIVLSSEHSVLDALSVINDGALRICLVVDTDDKLLGVITDGDIRRAILKDISLHEKTSSIMNRQPITVSSNTSHKQRRKIMQAQSILALPIVDAENKILGLETWEKEISTPAYENPVFIMAGGLGTRLRPLTNDCPKPMLKVGDKPILEILLTQFIKSGFKNIYISTYYMAEKIISYFGDGSDWGANIQYVHEDSPLGTGGALGLLPDNIQKLPLIMINGDVLTDTDFVRLLEFHLENNPIATMCVRQYEYQIPYGVINSSGNRIVDIKEKPVHHYFVNAGIYVISPELFLQVPKHERIDMPSLLDQQISESHDVLMYPLHEYWLDIGRMDDFHKAQHDVKELV